ncbi:3-methyl-2-oxobutanoate hydroxymethyltransferase [Oceanidesulfovibrio marinus]|uniref:3-methyl-2-oxobutanoate hydroxymethyltransferase n=1 Tax=Oceanidesulfovibrio marinus TaxID=370038 RepID=A0A6P1Z9Z6_9BACT|nr:3-methyl-2-oxobutanoate hydroxymethyltransferase [Oceanidesulfovibrio marinus]QJT10755.1 3-methyl-2-oxobutanoate hydroxymethyltransferase [Oceanidesulfovibrio marinus]TVM30365.1 3-methyl-2-oxobutanoate hydroxymethyltransferase [Oceanidesulfovibrio marinus]
MAKRITAPDIRASKGQRKITMLTAYDYPFAKIVDEAGIDMILVGDSLGMAVLGYDDTIPVTMDEMVHHCSAVTRGASHALVVGDMPFLSYEAGPEQALASAGRLFKEGGVRAVKLEGGREVAPQTKALVQAGIPVVGHVGLTPQRVAGIGGFKVQGKTADAARIILEDAKALQEAGCFAIILEAVPAAMGRYITEALEIPTIGIGGGAHCDGQVLVIHDVLGLFERFTPKFVKKYANMAADVREAVTQYKNEVESGVFPDAEHSFSMDPDEEKKLS